MVWITLVLLTVGSASPQTNLSHFGGGARIRSASVLLNGQAMGHWDPVHQAIIVRSYEIKELQNDQWKTGLLLLSMSYGHQRVAIRLPFQLSPERPIRQQPSTHHPVGVMALTAALLSVVDGFVPWIRRRHPEEEGLPPNDNDVPF